MTKHKFNSNNNNMFRIISTFSFALVFVFSGLLNDSSPNAMANAMPLVQESETSLKELQQKWIDIDAKLVVKENEIKSGEGDIKAAQAEFKSLIDEANDVIKQIENTAKAALIKEPENQEIVRILMGIMLNDAQLNRDAKVLALGDTLIANGVNPEYFTIASRSDRLTIPSRELFDELLIRHAEAMKNDLPRIKFTTTKGDIVLELFENEAPNSVANIVSLVESGFYADIIFHRVVDGFMAQTGGFKMEGDKEVGGEGPGYEIECECYTPEKRLHFTGSLSMAHRGKDTGGSQFFLTFERTSFLDGRHTCFGRVIEGHDVLDRVTRTHIGERLSGTGREEPIPGVTKDKIIKAEVIRKRDHKYQPKKVGVEEEPEEKVEEKSEEKAEVSETMKDETKKPADAKEDDKQAEPEPSDKTPAPKKVPEAADENESEKSKSEKPDDKKKDEEKKKEDDKDDKDDKEN